ncbi:hypothetical protein A2V61_03010 [Candidatus Woesebacteria bacterium RBG_19FT_COMBO_47_8]|nr:MAG: hypothetical protein A2V61_03010 [Candidatus Woesebacteria bacterium RBG_19FT_COMBO_47_8]
MSPEAKTVTESYLEGAKYLPEWRKVFSAEFSRIISQTDIKYEKGTYDGLQQLGLKVELDGVSRQLMRILPATADFPQLVFRLYEGRIKLLSGNKNREWRDWVKGLWIDLAEGMVGMSLGDIAGKEESVKFFGLRRRFDAQTTDEMHINLFPQKTIVLDAPLSFKR